MNTTSENQAASSPPLALTVMETILVVDDHPDLRLVVSLFLQQCGYRVLTANHGEHARKIARESAHIDLLLTDIEMPGMPGDELADWFHINRPRTAVVFMSGNSMHLRRLEPCYFVEKPFIHLETLLNAIREALRHAQSSQLTASAAA